MPSKFAWELCLQSPKICGNPIDTVRDDGDRGISIGAHNIDTARSDDRDIGIRDMHIAARVVVKEISFATRLTSHHQG